MGDEYAYLVVLAYCKEVMTENELLPLGSSFFAINICEKMCIVDFFHVDPAAACYIFHSACRQVSVPFV